MEIAEKTITKIKVSYRQIMNFRVNAVEYLKHNPLPTSFRDNLIEMFERTTEFETAWNKLYEKIERKHCARRKVGEGIESVSVLVFSTDKVSGKRIYEFTEEGLDRRDLEMDEEHAKEGACELEPIYLEDEDVPKNIPIPFRAVFTPFVIKPVLMN